MLLWAIPVAHRAVFVPELSHRPSDVFLGEHELLKLSAWSVPKQHRPKFLQELPIWAVSELNWSDELPVLSGRTVPDQLRQLWLPSRTLGPLDPQWVFAHSRAVTEVPCGTVRHARQREEPEL